MFNRYYQDELRYLRELAQEFAEKHENAGRLLEEFGTDPDVERLLEGVAFLVGRLREKLDDELPELTHGILQLIWPHYLRPVPCASILEFTPRPGMVTGARTIEKGTPVDSVAREGTVCHFRTVYPVQILPLRIEQVLLVPQNGKSHLRVQFQTDPGIDLSQLTFNALRFYLHGQREVATTLYLWLLRRVNALRVEGTRADGQTGQLRLRASSIHPVGFAESEALLPVLRRVFTGYRWMLEYFTLPEKFLFVDVRGLEGIAQTLVGGRFDLVFELQEDLPAYIRLKSENIRLFCTPIVNMFDVDARPIRLDHLQHEYRVVAEPSPATHYEVFSVDNVVSYEIGTTMRRTYLPVIDEGDMVRLDPARIAFTYQTSIRPSVVNGEWETFIAFARRSPVGGEPRDQSYQPQGASPAELMLETVSIKLTCTNGRLPESLNVGDIRMQAQESPPYAAFQNLMRPTPTAIPPLGRELLWPLIAHLGLNRLSLGSKEALTALLRVHLYPTRRDRERERLARRLVDGIEEVHAEPAEALERGCIIRGTRFRLRVKEANFQGMGDLFLFGSVLNALLQVYCTMNSFSALEIIGTEFREPLMWRWRQGRIALS